MVHERGIEPHVPVFDKSRRTDGTFSRDAFIYDHAHDLYRCPGGKPMTTLGTLVNDGATLIYRASKRDCDAARLSRIAVPDSRRARSPVRFTRARETWPATCRSPMPI